jgi:hypothetical protein
MDGYKDGRQSGASRAASGKSRSFKPANATQLVKMLVSDTYTKTHADGVRKGYKDGGFKS